MDRYVRGGGAAGLALVAGTAGTFVWTGVLITSSIAVLVYSVRT